MKKKSNVEKFTDSVSEFFIENSNWMGASCKEHIFCGELFIFYRQSGGVLRRSASSYTVLGGRHRRGEHTCGTDLGELLGLDSTGRRGLISLMEAGKSYVILPTDRGTAVIFSGLLRFCGMGICIFTNHSPTAAFAASDEEYAHLFGDAVFSPSFEDGDRAGVDEFISSYLEIEQRLSSMCGITQFDGSDLIELVMRSAASLAGCELSLEGGGADTDVGLDCAKLAVLGCCILMAVSEIAVERRVSVKYGGADDGTLIEVACECVGDMTEEGVAFTEYCRSFSDSHSIPFSLERSGCALKASFIPGRIDPSLDGLKAGTKFSASVNPTPDFHDAR